MKEEISFMYERSKKILDYLKKQSIDTQSDFLFKSFEQILFKEYELKNKKGLKIIQRDLEAWSKSLPKENQKELNIILNEESFYRDQETFIDNIILKNKVESKTEYEQLSEILKDLNEQDLHFKHIELLEKLLSNYKSK